MPPKIITIDGPGGTGKGTAAAALAQRIGFHFIDSGKLYRGLAWKALREDINPNHELRCTSLVHTTNITILDPGNVEIDGVNVTSLLHNPELDMPASIISQHSSVRSRINEICRDYCRAWDSVIDGRAGGHEFPDAILKVYMTAESSVRAERVKGRDSREADVGQIVQDLEKRDFQDANRTQAPMRPADDALIIDASFKSANEILQILLGELSKVAPELVPR